MNESKIQKDCLQREQWDIVKESAKIEEQEI